MKSFSKITKRKEKAFKVFNKAIDDLKVALSEVLSERENSKLIITEEMKCVEFLDKEEESITKTIEKLDGLIS